MATTQRFGIDIDGTITSPSTFLPHINKSFNLQINLNDMKEFDIVPLIGITEKEFWKWMDENEPSIYLDAPLASFAKKVLNSWKHVFDLIYISARRELHFDVTRQWFTKNSVYFNQIDLIGSHDKISTVKKHQISLFFEDKHDNACDISEECDIPVILFNTPYNQQPIPKNVIRVEDWQEAEKWVNHWFDKKEIVEEFSKLVR